MKIIALLCTLFFWFPLVYAGKAELDRDAAKAKADHDYAVAMCKVQKTEPVRECIKRHDALLKDVQQDLKSRLQGAQK